MKSEPVADIGFVLEGTYPFVPGGVSSWVHQLVRAMSDRTFSIIHISPRPGFFSDGHAYEVPDNVISIREVYLQRPVTCHSGRPSRATRRVMAAFTDYVAAMRVGDVDGMAGLAEHLSTTAAAPFSSLDLLASPEHWEVLTDFYRDEASEVSFLDFYWNWIFVHQPLINLLTVPLPRARSYHTVSTGYTGMIAALAAEVASAPMVLTEHGIYTKERRIEIHAAEWVPIGPEDIVPDISPPYFQDFWNRQFRAMSQLCYSRAQRVLTLYTGNRDEQIADGADPEKISIVPNGIDVARFAAAAERKSQRETGSTFTVGFVGRVCPIKDVHTFIAAMRLVKDQVPDLDARIMGPTEEDPDYVRQCESFIEGLGLGGTVRFMGRVALDQELDQLDVMVLTSISEAQPLVILEAGAVGVPVVSSDVGSCRELIMGRTAADRSLGRGGLLTPIASPGATARAILQLYEDPEFRRDLGQNLKRRVSKYFDHAQMIEAYREIYIKMLSPEVV